MYQRFKIVSLELLFYDNICLTCCLKQDVLNPRTRVFGSHNIGKHPRSSARCASSPVICLLITHSMYMSGLHADRFTSDQFSTGGQRFPTYPTARNSADEVLEHIAPPSEPCSHNGRSDKRGWLNKMENSITRAVTPRFATSS